MSSLEAIQAIIDANRAVQLEARKLNVRAGEQVFPVMTTDELRAWLSSRLNGAISCATISNLEALRLPPLPDGMVELVREMNPDTVTIFGVEVPVEYPEPSYYSKTKSPQVVLGKEFLSGNRWIQLPDEGIKLPGGRLVHIILKSTTEWSPLAEGSDIPALKKSMRDRQNSAQWENWSQPVITVPDFSVEGAVLPEIITAVYGKCVVTGAPLVAYGTLALNTHRWYSSDPLFRGEWFRVLADAEAAFSKVKIELEKAQAELCERREKEAAEKAVSVVQERARVLYGEMPYDTNDDFRFRSRLNDRAHDYFYSSKASDLRRWIVETETLIVEAETYLAETKRQKEEKTKQLKKLARPILRPGDVEDSYTVYGMPCNDEGPCESEKATSWRLFSVKEGEFTWHKGYRSQAKGTTFVGLVREYLRDEPCLEQVLRSIPGNGNGDGKKKNKATSSSSAPPSPSLDPLAVLRASWGTR